MAPEPELTYVGEVAAALKAAQPATKVLADMTDGLGLVVVARRNDHVVEQVDIERHLPAPIRPAGIARVDTATAFLSLLFHRISDTDRVTAYGDPDQCRLVAVLNDDEDGHAGWRDHRIVLDLKPTPEWQHWTSHQEIGSQERFAQVLEEGEDEIVEPSAAVMLDIAQSFHASTVGKFKQAKRLAGGKTQFVWEEETDAKAGDAGELKVPQTFTLRLRPFYGAKAVEVTARLRWTLKGGELKIGYELKRPDEVRRTSFAGDVLAAIRGSLEEKSIPLVDGQPAEPRSAMR